MRTVAEHLPGAGSGNGRVPWGLHVKWAWVPLQGSGGSTRPHAPTNTHSRAFSSGGGGAALELAVVGRGMESALGWLNSVPSYGARTLTQTRPSVPLSSPTSLCPLSSPWCIPAQWGLGMGTAHPCWSPAYPAEQRESGGLLPVKSSGALGKVRSDRGTPSPTSLYPRAPSLRPAVFAFYLHKFA